MATKRPLALFIEALRRDFDSSKPAQPGDSSLRLHTHTSEPFVNAGAGAKCEMKCEVDFTLPETAAPKYADGDVVPALDGFAQSDTIVVPDTVVVEEGPRRQAYWEDSHGRIHHGLVTSLGQTREPDGRVGFWVWIETEAGDRWVHESRLRPCPSSEASPNVNALEALIQPGWLVAYRDRGGRLRGGCDDRDHGTVARLERGRSGWTILLTDGQIVPMAAIRGAAETAADGRVVAAWTVRDHGPDGGLLDERCPPGD